MDLPCDARFVVTDYHAGTRDRPYRNILRRTIDDESVRAVDAVECAIEAAGAVDGDEITIIVVKTGRRPFGDRKVRWVRPHAYEREPETIQKQEQVNGY